MPFIFDYMAEIVNIALALRYEKGLPEGSPVSQFGTEARATGRSPPSFYA